MTTDFGTDLSWTTDVDPLHRMATGTLLVSQAIFRRLNTPRGALLDDPEYGYDLVGQLSVGQTQKQIGRVQSEVRAECLKDERVDSVDVVFTQVNNGNGPSSVWNVAISGTTAAGPFKLVVGVADAKALVLEAA